MPFYTAIAGNNHQLNLLIWDYLFYTKPTNGNPKLQEYVLEFSTVELKQLNLQNGMNSTLITLMW